MKTIINVLLFISALLLAYMCYISVLTPIQFEETKVQREKVIIKHLIDIRKAQVEFKNQHGSYTANYDSLITFLKTAKKNMVVKEGSLSDKQLEAGLTEASAAKIVRSGNRAEIIANGLEGFSRDTVYVSILEALYPNEYTTENIDKIAIIPFSKNEKFELKIENGYFNSSKMRIPLFEASAAFKSYLHDLNHQELLNVIDIQQKLEKFPGLKVGSVDEPNNNAGNWE